MNIVNQTTRGIVFCALLLACCPGAAVNLLDDGDIEGTGVPAAYRLDENAWMGTLANCEEDLTWNRCLKLTLAKIHVYSEGQKYVNLTFEAGGTKESPGFAVRAGEKYRFSFEARGTIPSAGVQFKVWDADGKPKIVPNSLGNVNFTAGWLTYRGTMTVPDGAVRAALVLRFFANEKKWPNPPCAYAVGQELFLDRFVVEPVSAGREIWPVRALVLPENAGAKVVADGFSLFGKSSARSPLASRLVVRSDGDKLVFGVSFSGVGPKSVKGNPRGQIWDGDSVEVFVQMRDPKADPLHVVLGVDGLRFTDASPTANESSWVGKVVHADADGWKAVIEIPWKSLGYAARPSDGSTVRFNVVRNALNAKKDRISVFSFTGTELKNAARFAVLYLGTPKGLTGDPSAFWLQGERRKEKERLDRLSRAGCIVTQMPVDLDVSLPFLPDELLDPTPKLALRGAVNERVQLPVAVANMTDAAEEYRVRLVCGYEKLRGNGYGSLADGLKSSDGKVIGLDRITLRRGVRYRDSDAKGHGSRYDVLARMDEVGALPVAAKDAGLLWIEINCAGVAPGRYAGELQLTPLVSGTWRKTKYETRGIVANCPVIEDDTKKIPVELEVLPFAIDVADFGFCGYITPNCNADIDWLNRLGGVAAMISPWSFASTFDAEGNLQKFTVGEDARFALELIRRRQDRQGTTPRLMAGYGTYEIFRRVHAKNSNLKPDSAAYWKAYGEYCRAYADFLVKSGFQYDDWLAEVIDEPDTRRFTHEEVTKAFRIARESVPQMKLCVTNGELEFFDEISPYVDLWIFKFFVYNDPKMQSYARQMRERGAEVSIYACYTEPRQNSHRYYRQLCWKAAAWGAKFVSLYQLRDWPQEVAFRKTTTGGIIHPIPGGCVPTVRFMSVEAGLNDIRYLKRLERLAETCPDAALRQEAQAFVRRSYEYVTRTSQHDPFATERFRDGCIELIRRLLSAPGAAK